MKDDKTELKYFKTQLYYKVILIVVAAVAITAVISTSLAYHKAAMKYSGSGIEIDSIIKALQDKEYGSESSDGEKSVVDDTLISDITKDLSKFTDLINTYYKGDIDRSKLAEETIKGYINGLGDEYSEYFTKDELEEFQVSALGNYYGIGISMLKNEDGNTEIVQVFEKTPAEESGIQSGDIISKINGEDFLGRTPEEASNLIKGDAGTTIELQLVRDGELIDLEVERREVKLYHVISRIVDGNIGYIFLYTFDSNCSVEFTEAVNNLKEQGATKFIIDLRYNTGGIVDEAVNIASLFVEKGTPVYYMVDSKDNETPVFTTKDPVDTDSPLVILVNKYSASASEILTGALKDRRNATLVGEKTYGKGVMQNLFNLKDGSALKLTFAEYLTPDKTHINKVGIEPDYDVSLSKESRIDPYGEKSVDDVQFDKAIEVLNEM